MSAGRITFHAAVMLIFAVVWAPGISAQEIDLVSFGTFSIGGATAIGGKDSYIIECNEKEYLCSDNFGNTWGFGQNLTDYRIRMCEQSFDVVSQDCVHTVQINLKLSQQYAQSIFEVQRPNCAVNEFFLDEDFIGSYRRDESGIGGRTNVEFAIGSLKPGKAHSLVITAPESDDGKCAPAIQVINITGLVIRGMPKNGL